MSSACGSSAFSVSRRGELLLAQAREQLRRRFTTRGVHPHVERPRLLVAEAAIGIVELHRGHAQVRQDQVRGREPFRGEHLRQTREVSLARDEGVGAEAGGAQTRFRCAATRADRRRGRSGVRRAARVRGSPAHARRRRACSPPRRRRRAGEGTQHLGHHDRPMRARRRLAGREDLLHLGPYRAGSRSLYFSWNARGFLPGYRGRRICTGAASAGVFTRRAP